MSKYWGKNPGTLPPHPYAISDVAYRQMLRDRKNQDGAERGRVRASLPKFMAWTCRKWDFRHSLNFQLSTIRFLSVLSWFSDQSIDGCWLPRLWIPTCGPHAAVIPALGQLKLFHCSTVMFHCSTGSNPLIHSIHVFLVDSWHAGKRWLSHVKSNKIGCWNPMKSKGNGLLLVVPGSGDQWRKWCWQDRDSENHHALSDLHV